MYKTVQINYISICLDICTINIRVSIRVRGLHLVPMIGGSGGSKSRLAKAAGAEPSGQMRDEKLHADVARSTFRSQNAQNAPASDHFLN